MNDDTESPGTNKQFLFASYARTDASIVLADVAMLRAAGVPVWYDEAIPGGALWREELAQRIAESCGVVCFLSSNFVRSQYCIAEISFAIDAGTPLVCVYVEPLSLTAGLRMSVGHRQGILRYSMPAATYHERLTVAAQHLISPPTTMNVIDVPTTQMLPDSLMLHHGSQTFVVPAHFGGRYYIGRSQDCQVMIDSFFISRRHGYVVAQHGSFRYHDQSSNGTIVKSTTGETLVHGDVVTLPNSGELRLGDVTILFKVMRGPNA